MTTLISKDNNELAAVLNRREGQAPFNKPWELRVFAIAVAACEAGEFEWAEFQEALTEVIKQWEAANPGFTQDDWSYYEHFVIALEVVLASHGKLSEDGLDQRAQVILETPVHKHHVAKYDPIMIDPARI
ncbi:MULTISPECIES: nitrile hydratase accessory protein [unclassified Brenneria]|uniref:nitrile hydratase accessory protein n=1 Tax=unclassified Brenneria TaxID=2634434 RepID=UPI00155733D2|nr:MULTISPECIES: nitrile hydratase accessory protein [unclassified Brenneria]MBJ7220804.1 nitrile hydratase accessory protein [Brenneria sp. L3-3C-1]MEE3642044.1 nitrile hydratase accessory protein [Brenneria sp. L3_3C_1]MEE3649259.1 nitrile hydratase accessory protein [Brenneria sp. HEZEL_4_2_4]NPC99212.1 nitrile hydratase accessory protein [Brenneria sp. hezel4-2-4]